MSGLHPDTSMTVRAALTVAASNEQPEWSLGRRLVEQHRVVMTALARDAAEHREAVVPLPAVDTLALMLAAADRLWCEDTGDEQASPEFWQAIAARLDSIARSQHADPTTPTSAIPTCATASPSWAARPLGSAGEDDAEVWIPPSYDAVDWSKPPCPHCGLCGFHRRTGRCSFCGRRPSMITRTGRSDS